MTGRTTAPVFAGSRFPPQVISAAPAGICDRGGADLVVVDASAERIGTVSGPYVHGDATSEEVLRAAGIHRALPAPQ